MTAITMNFASPRLLLVAAGAVRQIADVLAKFGLSRPLIVTDPRSWSALTTGLAGSRRVGGLGLPHTVPDPTDAVIEAGASN